MENKSLKSRFGAGFTIIELLVAIFILSIGILTVIIMFPLGLKLVSSSKMTAQAIQLGQEKIEQTISYSYEAISVGENIEPQLFPPFTHYQRKTRITYIDPLLNFQETDTDKGVKKVEITVSWQSALLEREVKLTTIISKK